MWSADGPTIFLRAVAVMGSLAAWYATQRMIGARAVVDGEMYDRLHVLTARWNAWLHAHPRHANGVLIASSLCVDVVTLAVLTHAVFGPSFRPFWGVCGLFALRQVSQAAVALPIPPGIIWRDPGVPSLFVTYGVGNDFFFSGHTALAVYGALHLATLGIPALTVTAAAIAVLQMLAVIVLRAHWTLDVIAGLCAAVAAGLLVR